MTQNEIEKLRKEPKEARLEYFFRFYEWGMGEEILGLTEEDVRDYQLRKEAEVSMKPTEKRDILVKQMLKPLLKENGFKSSGYSWWKELEDSWLFIHMKNSRWNGMGTGANFQFRISVSGKDDIKGKLADQWMCNRSYLSQDDFLPYWGRLAPRMTELGYKIDGYRNYLPLDEPLDEIIEQVRGDFADHILPELEPLRTKAGWEILYQEKCTARETVENRLLRYYSSAHMLAASESNIPALILTQTSLALTPEEITSHFDWLEIIQHHSSLPCLDAKEFILGTLDAG